MKAMEEEVLIKNGEIKILRDSLHQTESILEEQRRSHFLLEQEKTQALSDREKEFSKKLQSLQSELQFKDAEMNELRTKLQSSERTNKPAVPSVSHVSPRKSPTVIIKPNASSPVFGKTLFPTKESFTANMSLPPPCQTEPGHKSLVGKAESKTHNVEVDLVHQEDTQESAVDIWVRKPKAPGCILISLLLKQPLIPESPFSLCDLLSGCSETLTGALQSPGLGSSLTGVSGLRTAGSCDGSFSLSALKEAQNLALTGLNLVARDKDSCGPADEGRRAFPLCQLPGAVHLLPLAQFFIGLHCRALQDLATTAKRSGAPGDSAAHASCVNPGAEANPEDPLCSLEGLSAASLGLLQHLVCHSGAVVCQLLSGAEGASVVSGGGPRPANRRAPGGVPLAPEGLASDQGQHPLLKMLLHLVTFSSVATGYLQTSVLSQCLKVLVKLAENASFDFLPRFRGVFPVLPRCLGADVPLRSVLLAAKLLSLLADHQTLAPQLCAHSERCPLLLLCLYVTSRPDRAASETQWLQLEQEVVWLLAKLGVQSPPSPVLGSDCQCGVEVVRALTGLLHRQWLTVRRAGAPPRTGQHERTVRCLRDTVLLLHSLSRKDKLFTVHCVEVLHQYDQVLPGVGALIRGLPDVTDCEEAALDDLCAAETDVEDHEMDCG
ncbi:ATR-interacting protein isoform X3 [Erinaceus europaeus]|nr:ATR-interacting protein isoform X3 [Erinaceus europaeus]